MSAHNPQGFRAEDIYQGLELLAKDSFPRKCNNCGMIYETFEQLLEATRAMAFSSGVLESIDDDDRPILEIYRNCTCGSTLVEFCKDRRDSSPQGKARRNRFGSLLKSLNEQGISTSVARQELLKIIHGKRSALLEGFLEFPNSFSEIAKPEEQTRKENEEIRIIIVDDEENIIHALKNALRKTTKNIISAKSAAEALSIFQSTQIDIAVVDRAMPGMSGIELLEIIKNKYPQTIRILITGFIDREALTDAINRCDIYKFLSKPFDPSDLRLAIQRALEKRELERHNQRLQDEVLRQNEALIKLNRSLEQNVAERTRQLEHAQANLNAIIESSHDGLLTIDKFGRIQFLTRMAREILGWPKDELIGTPFADLLVETNNNNIIADRLPSTTDNNDKNSKNNKWRAEGSLIRQDGSTFQAELSLSQLKGANREIFSIFIRDITEQSKHEAENRHAQKLEAVGRLASGIAHEINTPIQFIGDNIHFLEDAFVGLIEFYKIIGSSHKKLTHDKDIDSFTNMLKEAEEVGDIEYLCDEAPLSIKQSLEGVERITSIVRAMKEFAHPDNAEMSIVDLNRSLESTLTVARNEIKYVADVELDLDPTLPPVCCCAGDLNQVFLNLLVNAAHAIEDNLESTDARGSIRVATAQQDDGVLISIGDTGAGIPEHVRENIFDPFFTTKGVGRGTGQGLAIARSIVVDKHGGSIRFDTELGEGTTFHIFLPHQKNSSDVCMNSGLFES